MLVRRGAAQLALGADTRTPAASCRGERSPAAEPPSAVVWRPLLGATWCEDPGDLKVRPCLLIWGFLLWHGDASGAGRVFCRRWLIFGEQQECRRGREVSGPKSPVRGELGGEWWINPDTKLVVAPALPSPVAPGIFPFLRAGQERPRVQPLGAEPPPPLRQHPQCSQPRAQPSLPVMGASPPPSPDTPLAPGSGPPQRAPAPFNGTLAHRQL